MLPRSATIELDMTVDEALKYIISMGVVSPTVNRKAELLRLRQETNSANPADAPAGRP
jgi:uncharacterized membrane protein